LIRRIAQAIVDYPEQVSVKKIEGVATTVYELRVAKKDAGKVIGKQGQNVNAIRTILSAASAKEKERCVLELVVEAKSKVAPFLPDARLEDRPKKTFEKQKGTVTWFDEKKGYGFIRADDGQDVFVHNSSVEGAGLHPLADGDRVAFDIEQGSRGPKAANVVKA
jgi:cold shock CspA family protein/predicted RNA-binding protein YlqC (UPF0109 family)